MGKGLKGWITGAAIAPLLIVAASAQTSEDALEEPLRTTNFHSVGFDYDLTKPEVFGEYIAVTGDQCDVHTLNENHWVCSHQKDTGGQIWIGFRVKDRKATLTTANPAFVGKSVFPVRVEGVQSDPEWEPFEYRLAVTFSDYNIPLLVEVADPREAARFRNMAEPVEMTLDLTAFTFNPEIFEDEQAFLAAQQELGEDVSYAPNFFIPSGLMGDTPSARATFGGEILEAERMTTADGASHWRTLVRVQGGGTVNVVFDDIWPELDPKPGQLISSAFWLSAQVPAAE